MKKYADLIPAPWDGQMKRVAEKRDAIKAQARSYHRGVRYHQRPVAMRFDLSRLAEAQKEAL